MRVSRRKALAGPKLRVRASDLEIYASHPATAKNSRVAAEFLPAKLGRREWKRGSSTATTFSSSADF